MEKGNIFSLFIQKFDKAKETGEALRRILIDASIGEDADKGTTDLFAQDLHGVLLREGIVVAEGEKPGAVLLDFRDFVKIDACENGVFHGGEREEWQVP